MTPTAENVRRALEVALGGARSLRSWDRWVGFGKMKGRCTYFYIYICYMYVCIYIYEMYIYIYT